jgi:hypothetical protein
MAGEKLTETDLLARWGISQSALNTLVGSGRLSATQEGGERVFDEEEVQRLEQAKGGDDFVGYDEVLQELQLNRNELDELIESGKLEEYSFGDETRFELEEVQSMGTGKKPTDMGSGPGKEPTVFQVGEEEAVESPITTFEIGEPEEEEEAGAPGKEALLDLETEAEAEEEVPSSFFDFTEELETEMKTEEVEEVEAAEAEEAEVFEIPELEEEEEELAEAPAGPGEETIPFETEEEAEELDTEMITDVLEIGAEESTEEEDLLGDIIEDVSGGVEEAVEAPEYEEEITAEELTTEATGEETMTSDLTAEITQMEEEVYEEGEELEEILEPEEALGPEFAVPEAAPAAPAEVPVPVWAVAVMAVALVILCIGALFLIQNAGMPGASPKWIESINPF